jgi:hypothetical protein
MNRNRTEDGAESQEGIFLVSRKLIAEMNEIVSKLVSLSHSVHVETSLLASCLAEQRHTSQGVTVMPGKRDVSYSTNL